MTTPTDRIQLRARFWPRYFRWAVTFQLGWALLVGIGLAARSVQGEATLSNDVLFAWAVVSGVLALVALGIAFRRRSLGCAEITPLGIRPYTTWSSWDIKYAWQLMETVRLKAGPFGNRWLEVHPLDGTPFKLTARPTDPEAVLDALERFAGPDHPLTQAYFTLLDK